MVERDGRYSRQELFKPIGEQGQNMLAKKHAVIVGIGALGTASAEMLVRSGIGRLTIIDRDYVEESNLQRQHLFTEADAAAKQPKAAAARHHLAAINRYVRVEAIVGEADPGLLSQLASSASVLIDGTDNFETRFIMNDIAQKYRIPYLFGSCVGSSGMACAIIPGDSPCLCCLLKKLPVKGQTCDTAGIIGPAVQMVAARQAAAALKILTGNEQAVSRDLFIFDLWEHHDLAVKTKSLKDPRCPSCGEESAYPYLSGEATVKTAVLCGRDTVQIRPACPAEVPVEVLGRQWRAAGYKVHANSYLVSVETAGARMVLFRDGRALVHGTSDPAHARKIYQLLLG